MPHPHPPFPIPHSPFPIHYTLYPGVSAFAALSIVDAIAFVSLISSKVLSDLDDLDGLDLDIAQVLPDLDLDLDLDLDSRLNLDLDSCIDLKNTGLDLATALTKALVFPCLIELARLRF
jgi:hypothetical protein